MRSTVKAFGLFCSVQLQNPLPSDRKDFESRNFKTHLWESSKEQVLKMQFV